MERVAVDTTFLIDLQNERRQRGQERGAERFLRAHLGSEFLLPVVARGEYLEGFDRPDSPEALSLVDALKLLDLTKEVASTYAKVVRRLRAEGRLIGSNDLWIGCAALAAGLPLVTRNADEFRRISGLVVVEYAP